MPNEYSVLIVDDDPTSVFLVESLIEDFYDIESVNSGAECLELLERSENKPDIILLDVAMPEMDGYEVCLAVKNHTNLEIQHIPILFVSARETAEERLKGLSVGAEDYIVKPFANAELMAKIERTLSYASSKSALEDRLEEANRAVFAAMSDSAERGSIVSFVESTYSIKDFEGLATSLFKALRGFNLSCCLQLRFSGKVYNYSSEGVCKPIEAELLDKLKGGERIHTFNQRKVFNYPNASLLVKNMPVDDKDKDGRYTDHLPIMLSTVNARVESLADQYLVEQKHQLEKAIATLSETMTDSTQLLKRNTEESGAILRDMLQSIEEKLVGMGLEEDQESYLVSLLDEGVNRAVGVIQRSEDIEESFLGNISVLKKLVKGSSD